MSRWIAIGVVLALVAGCGPSERPKFNIKRAADLEPIIPPDSTATASASATESAAPEASADAEIVEIGAFAGRCNYSFSGINAADVVALADPSGLRGYRLAGIAIPPAVREESHAQLESWLTDEPLGVEAEAGSTGAERSVYIYRCSAKTMLNAELVGAGLAVVIDAPSMHRDVLDKASMEALAARRGVWAAKTK
jgi:endonuclease YncB( thermonuclease family)